MAIAAIAPAAWADDVTDTYLVNAGFDDETCFATADVAGNTDPVAVTGWAVSETGEWGASAAFAFGSTSQLNGAAVPTAAADGSTTGGVLGLSAGWGYARVYKQSVTLPAGLYTITYSAYNANTATPVGTNKIGFVSDDGVAYLSDITGFSSSKWTTGSISFELTGDASGNITVGFAPASGGSGNSAKLFVDYIKIDYFESVWAQTVSGVKATLDQHPQGAETERAAVLAKAAAESGSDADIEGLNSLLDAFLAAVAVDEYNVEYAAEIATANEVEAAKAKYPYTYETLLSSDLTTWTTNDYALNNGAEHWSGPDKTPYYEQTGSEWGQSSWSHKAAQTVELPAGKYAMFITARGSSGIASTMSVTVGEETQTVELAHNDATGRGIATDGTATFAYDATYAKDGAGYGWKYAYIEFETTEENKQATISFASSATTHHQWVSIANPVLYGTVSLVDVYKSRLQSEVAEVSADLENDPNADGTALKRIPSVRESMQKKLAEAKAVAENAEATLEEVETQRNTVATLLYTYQHSEITAPAEEDVYNIVMNDEGLTWSNKAATFTAREDGLQGGYGIAYSDEAGAGNFIQAIHFVAAESEANVNTFKLYIEDNEGTKHYICDGKAVGNTVSWADAQLRCTTNEEDALLVSVIPSLTLKDAFELYNTKTSVHIGSANDNGFYCSENHYGLSILPAAQQEVTATVEEGAFAGIVLPFAASVATGQNVYSVTYDSDADAVVLSAVTELEACVPYIVGAGSYAFKGYSVASAKTYTEGLLTGVLSATTAPVGAYTIEGAQLVVVAEGETPAVAANGAYATLPEAAAAQTYALTAPVPTGIEAIDALTAGKAEIYDLNGRKLNSLRKGINIVNGVKVLVK
jgi:hypothetical protein